MIESEKLRYFIGKEVEVSIRESEIKKKKKRTWKSFGKADLGGKLDDVNIREYSYE